jgi:hypothetical protein
MASRSAVKKQNPGPEYRAKETASAKVPLGLENRANAFGPEKRPNLDLLSIG